MMRSKWVMTLHPCSLSRIPNNSLMLDTVQAMNLTWIKRATTVLLTTPQSIKTRSIQSLANKREMLTTNTVIVSIRSGLTQNKAADVRVAARVTKKVKSLTIVKQTFLTKKPWLSMIRSQEIAIGNHSRTTKVKSVTAKKQSKSSKREWDKANERLRLKKKC